MEAGKNKKVFKDKNAAERFLVQSLRLLGGGFEENKNSEKKTGDEYMDIPLDDEEVLDLQRANMLEKSMADDASVNLLDSSKERSLRRY